MLYIVVVINNTQFVASELKDPIWHSLEWQIGSFSSEATIYLSSHLQIYKESRVKNRTYKVIFWLIRYNDWFIFLFRKGQACDFLLAFQSFVAQIYGIRLCRIGVGSFTEVKERRARFIIGWVTAWDCQMPYTIGHCAAMSCRGAQKTT